MYRTRAVVVVAAAMVTLVFVPAGADAATNRTITTKTSKTSVSVGEAFTISGKVSKSPKGTMVYIDLKSGSKWKLILAAKTTNKAGNYSLAGVKTNAAGKFTYRSRVKKTSKLRAATSATRTVTSTWIRGSFQNPFSVLESFDAPGWSMQVFPADTDAWPEIAPQNPYNRPPQAGWAYVMAEVKYTRTGSTAQAPVDGMIHSHQSAANTNHMAGCGVLPNSMYRIAALEPGESAIGNICAEVPKSEIPGGSWRLASMSGGGFFFVHTN